MRGNWVGVGGRRGKRPTGDQWGSCSLHHVLEGRSLPQRLAHAAATFQFTQHGFGQDVGRFGVFGPLQLLLTRLEVIEHVAEPEQLGLALAHRHTHFRPKRVAALERCLMSAKAVPRSAHGVRSCP